MASLGVNIDHVATVRQARRTYEPDPVWAAIEAELGGADQITVHLREDRRHIQERDVELLLKTIHTRVNLELAVDSDVIKVALKLKPRCACLVPEKREALYERGWEYGIHRITSGAAYPSDFEGGHIAATLAVNAMMKNPEFRADFDAAKAEVRKGLGLS